MLLRTGQFTFPTPPEQLFGRRAPLVLEIGFGDGCFLVDLASRHPEWNLLGVEISPGSVRRARRRILQAGLQNVRLYLGQARFLVRNVLPPRSLHCVYVNFPDPWPKERHRERRLLQPAFFALLSTRLEAAGTLRLTTDDAPYFAFALEAAQQTGLFRVEVTDPPPETLQTKYARKWQAQKKSIYHAVFHKVAEAYDLFLPTIERYDVMHHAVLEGELPKPEHFEKLVHAFEGGHVILLAAYRALDDSGLLFLARIEEEELVQEVLLEVAPRDSHVLVRVLPFGLPLSTRGTREAIRCLSSWLEAQGMRLREMFF
jgi:tRNA (guanine-N7-)-methyltransferase